MRLLDLILSSIPAPFPCTSVKPDSTIYQVQEVTTNDSTQSLVSSLSLPLSYAFVGKQEGASPDLSPISSIEGG